MTGVEAILFDKDGTLFDFQATWGAWAVDVIDTLAEGHEDRAAALADAARFDRQAARFHPDSPIIAGTNREAAERLAAVLPGTRAEALEGFLSERAAQAPLVAAADLVPLLDRLRNSGLALGVVTNDTEAVARAHLSSAGVQDRFRAILGFDSGHGSKPEPGPLLAAARLLDATPERCLMVGDSRHDLLAAQAAGMTGLGVLTGPAQEAELAPLAAEVLGSIGELPRYLGLG
ncbi:HAD family hydrolase [Litorisediminicola beolgyonensis]|uniref:phosphoglycolate phosphatase n=1 Tax=Litorisediminicola beolgyonensis TaxID=1173614 RepID=A0ABW3ZKF8_9RHOB